jgi:hypothetical protein
MKTRGPKRPLRTLINQALIGAKMYDANFAQAGGCKLPTTEEEVTAFILTRTATYRHQRIIRPLESALRRLDEEQARTKS